MLLSGIPYCAFHFVAFAGVPVTIPASRQCLVFCSAGAIWLVLRLPSPTSAKPSFFSCRLVVGVARWAIEGTEPRGRISGAPAAASADMRTKSRREVDIRVIRGVDGRPPRSAGDQRSARAGWSVVSALSPFLPGLVVDWSPSGL